MYRIRLVVFTLLVLCGPNVYPATLLSVSGFLNDSGNAALIGSPVWAGGTPPTPLFADDFDIANNVALHTFSVAAPGNVNFLSSGFAAGGVDPYFTLFSGTGETATFLGSNFAQAFSTGGDFDLNFLLSAGDYTLALGAFANMSFAENLGAGALGDGFIALGGPSFLWNYYYELEVSTGGSGAPIPEP